MEENKSEQAKNQEHCLGCLCSSQDHKISEYTIQYDHFWSLFEVSTLKLCYVCRRVAQRAEHFIQNVHCSQTLLLNCVGELTPTVQEARTQLQPTISLTQTKLDLISYRKKMTIKQKRRTASKCCKTNTEKIEKKPEKIFICTKPKAKKDDSDEVQVTKRNENVFKTEVKLEGDISEDVDGNFEELPDLGVKGENELLINGDRNDLANQIKVEKNEAIDDIYADCDLEFDDLQDIKKDNYVLSQFEKVLTKVESSNSYPKKQSSRKNKKDIVKNERLKNKLLLKNNLSSYPNEEQNIAKIYLKINETMEERRRQASNPAYLSRLYKCEDCIKGFNFKAPYLQHMKQHSEEAGQYVCSICKIRMDKRHKWLKHERSHNVRWKCQQCGVLRTTRIAIVEHDIVVHKKNESHFTCPHCSKTFKRQKSVYGHIRNSHETQERPICDYCKKTYANKEVIEAHMRIIHSKEILGLEPVKKVACDECGKLFRSHANLKVHKNKHSSKRNYYCVECDKGFKSEAALKKHWTTTKAHVSNSELPLPCDQCDKRFAIKRDLQLHISCVHLELKPYKCDQCDKAYARSWTLQEHVQKVHEGRKPTRRYPCEFCDKSFHLNYVLKEHIRTHTGERPYQCDKCPAQFSQSGVLSTHKKLIHQRLTRDGKPQSKWREITLQSQ